MTRVIYIHHAPSAFDLEPYIKDNFSFKKIFADDKGQMFHEGKSVPYTFFDHHADVIVTTLPTELHRSVAQALPHIPSVGTNSYHGMYASGKNRNVWREHAKHKSNDLTGIKVPHSVQHDPNNPLPFHELRNKVFLPSHIHTHGSEFGSNQIKTFPELQEYLSQLNEPAHIERKIKGDHVYILSIKDFRDQDIYTTPPLYKTSDGYKLCTHIKDEQKNDASQFAQELHSELGLGPVAQFEFVITPNEDLYLVHIEPNPDHQDNAPLHAGIESIGSSMKDLWENIIENARKRK